ncbi:hypothetical protein MTO96_035315 [Rhipicephalus appendiculatus]
MCWVASHTQQTSLWTTCWACIGFLTVAALVTLGIMVALGVVTIEVHYRGPVGWKSNPNGTVSSIPAGRRGSSGAEHGHPADFKEARKLASSVIHNLSGLSVPVREG